MIETTINSAIMYLIFGAISLLEPEVEIFGWQGNNSEKQWDMKHRT